MPLETGDYISDLVETNPPGTDNVSQGDDHLRLIKHVLKTTFPNVNGPITSTDEELSDLSGGLPKMTTYTSPVTAQTHTFEVGRKWYKIIITGGGGGGGSVSGDPQRGYGGYNAGTVIKAAPITELSATYTVGAGGAANANGEDSTWVEGSVVNLLAGRGNTYVDGNESIATGGDINLAGGSPPTKNDRSDPGAGSYWGPSSFNEGAGAPGSGGAGGDVGVSPTTGRPGIIVIEEY